MNECKEFPFTIVNHEEIPLGYPSAGLYRHLHLTNQGGTSVSPRSVRRHLYTLASDRTFKAVGEPFGRSGENVVFHVRNTLRVKPRLSERSIPAFIGIDEISLAKGKGKYRLVMYDP